jgi:hypothetical protein
MAPWNVPVVTRFGVLDGGALVIWMSRVFVEKDGECFSWLADYFDPTPNWTWGLNHPSQPLSGRAI